MTLTPCTASATAALLARCYPMSIRRSSAEDGHSISQPMWRLALITAVFLLATPPHASADAGLIGDWREPGGSIIQIARCGPDLCATLVAISAKAPSPLDLHNPDPDQRAKPLCGLIIGKSFHESSPDHAEGGMLYDPKSGRTYHGEMTATGDTLALRGYVGLKLFGRTESWTRTPAGASCSPQQR